MLHNYQHSCWKNINSSLGNVPQLSTVYVPQISTVYVPQISTVNVPQLSTVKFHKYQQRMFHNYQQRMFHKYQQWSETYFVACCCCCCSCCSCYSDLRMWHFSNFDRRSKIVVPNWSPWLTEWPRLSSDSVAISVSQQNGNLLNYDGRSTIVVPNWSQWLTEWPQLSCWLSFSAK